MGNLSRHAATSASSSTLLSSENAQVDLIVCFDASASPIRNIQRIGRTGRHRAGRVLYILAQGKEMDNYHRNKEVLQF